MTPEELNRTIEFIIASQARLAAAQEHDRQDRVEFQEWSKAMNDRMDRRFDRDAVLFVQQAKLLEHQSLRMDRLDKFYQEATEQTRGFQEQSLNFQQQSLDFYRQALDFQKESVAFQKESVAFQKESVAFQKESVAFQKQALHLLNLILDRLPPSPFREAT